MSYTITPVKEQEIKAHYKISPVDIAEVVEGVLPKKGFQNRILATEELWVIGLQMMKSGQLMRFTILGDKKRLVDMRV